MQPLIGRILENTLCMAALLVVALVALYPASLGQAIPGDTTGVLNYPPWEEARPADLTVAPGPQPLAQRYFPWSAFLADSAQRGDPPLWNPNENCGIPFWALWKTRCLSPFSVPYYLLPVRSAFIVSILLKLFVAGLCAFYATRRLGFAPPFALFVGIAFELSGHVYLRSGMPLSDVAAWLPLLLLYAERLALRQTWYWPIGAVIIGLMLLGGEPEAVAAALLFSGVFILLRMLIERRSVLFIGLGLVGLGLSTILGLGLAGVQLVPFIEFLRFADPSLLHGSAAAARFSDATLWFLPRFISAPTAASTSDDPQLRMLFHLGLIQMLLLPLWLSLRRFVVEQQRRRIEAMLLAAAAMLALACSADVIGSTIPYLHRLTPQHYLLANALVLALMAAAAAEEWLMLDPDETHSTLLRLSVLAPLMVVFAVAVGWQHYHTVHFETGKLLIQLLISLGFALALFGVMVVTLLRPSIRGMGYGLSALTAVQLLVAFYPQLTFTQRELVFPETSFIQSLKETGGRISGSAALARWPLAGNLAPQVYGSSGLYLWRQTRFLNSLRKDPLLLRRTGAPALLLTKEDIQGAFASVRPMLRIRRVFSSGAILFDDLGMKPRAWMAYDWRNTPSFDPALVSSSLPPLVEGDSALPASAPSTPAKVTMLDSPHRNSVIKVHIDDTPPGLLVLADSFYPGWKATVDGTSTPIVAVDGLFRGVPVAAGSHDVEFVYEPYSLKLGLQISEVTGVLTLLGLVRLLVKRKNAKA